MTTTEYIRPRIRTRTPVTTTTAALPGQFPEGSTVDRCIQGLHQLATPHELRAQPVKSKPQCITDWKSYLRLQAYNKNGLTVSQIDTVIIQHQRVDSLRSVLQAWAKAVKKTTEPINVPNDPYHIFVRTKVMKKSGKVKVTLDCPMGDYYDKYRDTSTPPPTLEEKLIAAKRFGYPDRVLEGIIKADDKWKKKLPKIEEMIVRVFGEGKSKPPTAAALAKAKKVSRVARMNKLRVRSRVELVSND